MPWSTSVGSSQRSASDRSTYPTIKSLDTFGQTGWGLVTLDYWSTDIYLCIIRIWVPRSKRRDDVEQLGRVEQKQEGAKNKSLRKINAISADRWPPKQTRCVLSKRKDRIHASTAPSRPNLDCSLDSKILWSRSQRRHWGPTEPVR